MDLVNCYLIVEYKRDDTEGTIKNLRSLIQTAKKIPLFIQGGFLYIEGRDSYLKITPKSSSQITELQIQDSNGAKINGLSYSEQKCFLGFRYDEVNVHISFKSEERQLEEKVSELEKKVK